MNPYELNLRQLRAIPLVHTMGSLTSAAEKAGMSQPALTQGLRRLEDRLGVTLFERRPDGVIATDVGVAFCDRLNAGFGHLEASVRSIARRPRGFARPDRMMTGTQLRALLAVADAGSFVGGSNASGMSQPALHRAVRELEQIVGATLVERRGRGVAVTRAGRQLARGARLAAIDLAAGVSEVTGEDGGQIVSLGSMPLARARVLPDALSKLLAVYPSAAVRIVEGSWRELVEPLRDGSVDMMVGALRDPPPADLHQEALFTDEVSVIGRAGHPLAGSAPHVEDLARFGWIVSGPGTPVRARWEALFETRVLPAAPVECGSIILTRRLLANTDLLALSSLDQVELEISSGLLTCIAGALPGATRVIGLITRAGWRPNALQSALIAKLRSASTSYDSQVVMAPLRL